MNESGYTIRVKPAGLGSQYQFKIEVSDHDTIYTGFANNERSTRKKIKKGIKYLDELNRLKVEFHK